MNHMRSIGLLLFLFAATRLAADATTYAIDPSASHVIVQVGRGVCFRSPGTHTS